ncbi:MAG: hypothetical protein HY443_01860 [Candidatus Nealsonbacteria bacterium]|nr:hypothetical protein [Candidatus Nealsonbacteria bacterium]
MKKDYLIVGHFAKDLKSRGFSLGGSVFYSGLCAKSLGYQVKISTSFGPDLEKKVAATGFKINRTSSPASTVFKNIYNRAGQRSQFLSSLALPLDSAQIPREWLDSPIVQIAPIAKEVKEKSINSFKRKNSLIGVVLQGWLRDCRPGKEVSFSYWKNYRKVLPRADIAFLSEEDVKNHEGLIKEFAKFSPLLVLTQGKRGCSVFHRGKVSSFEARKIKEKNPTGAGDVFASAFLVEFKKTKNFNLAAEFANSIAAKHVACNS